MQEKRNHYEKFGGLRLPFPFSLKVDSGVACLERICKARDSGMPESKLKRMKPSEEPLEEFKTEDPSSELFPVLGSCALLMNPCFSPWDSENFTRYAVNAVLSPMSVWDWSIPEFEYTYSPFDERFPSVVVAKYEWTNQSGMVRVNPRTNHHAKHYRPRPNRRLNKLWRMINLDRVETRKIKRACKNALCRKIPPGLRFPRTCAFEAVSPFDDRFPCNARHYNTCNTPGSIPRLVTITGLLPFPAFSPLVTRHSGRFFNDITSTIAHGNNYQNTDNYQNILY